MLILLLGIYYYVALPAINIHAAEFWIFLIILIVLAAAFFVKKKKLNRYEIKDSKGLKLSLYILAERCCHPRLSTRRNTSSS